MTNDKERYTLRMPVKYANAIKSEAGAIGTTMSAVILRIFAKHFGYLEASDNLIVSQGEGENP